MALTFKKKLHGSKVGLRDAAKSRKLHFVFSRLSKKIDKEVKTELLPPKSRSNVKVKIELSRSGGLAGMHSRANPPDSGHMKKIRAMRKFYNRQMPALQCSGCAFASSCPQFKAGYECAFLPYLNSHSIGSEQDLIESMKNLTEANVRRAHLQTLMETLQGGMPTLEVSESLSLAFNQLRDLHERIEASSKATVSIESEDESIIAKLFGNMDNLLGSTKEAREHPIDVPLMRLPEKAESIDSETNLDLIREHSKDELNSLLANTDKQVAPLSPASKHARKKPTNALQAVQISSLT